MPLTRLVADAFGVVTICLVSLLVLLGLLCVLYSIYFRTCIKRQGFIQLGYFNRPWIIRITLILYAIWWGFGEVVRLSLLRRGDRVLHDLSLKWQETLCKFYVLSNLGFAEPCLFLTIVFLLRASLQKRELGTLSQQWNGKTAGYVLLNCLPLFAFQCIVVLTGPKFNKEKSYGWKFKMPHYFTSTATSSKSENDNGIAFCTYPLLSTILLGLFAALLTGYLLLLGRRMVSSVINKGLRKRALILICTVSGFFPLRVILLGLSVLSPPEHFLFEALVFFAFLVLLACAGSGIWMLVYYPIADSLALRRGLGDLEIGRRRSLDDQNDTASLIANQILLEASLATSLGRISDASTKRGSISFRTMLKDEAPNAEMFEEVSLYSPDAAHRRQLESPPASPPAPGQPMLPLRQIS
ncbi:hypothetical protein BVC80_8529g8 [Macleaya cordata]|uniref:Plasminogen activator inhibitor n=1 Tax=Macleaya cordata TaxID=56857 RepID=A0A200Q2Y1_MACCD|nr:hypothetical protein BVC80_8529g8 [Macleaya cordata]